MTIVKEGTLFAGTGVASRHGKTSSAQLVTPRTKYRAKRPWKKLRVLSIITTFLLGRLSAFVAVQRNLIRKYFWWFCHDLIHSTEQEKWYILYTSRKLMWESIQQQSNVNELEDKCVFKTPHESKMIWPPSSRVCRHRSHQGKGVYRHVWKETLGCPHGKVFCTGRGSHGWILYKRVQMNMTSLHILKIFEFKETGTTMIKMNESHP